MPETDVRPWNRFLEFLVEATRVFRGFSMALDAKKLAFAFAGVVIWAVGSMVMNVLWKQPWILILAAGAVAVLVVLFFFARGDKETPSRQFVVTVIGLILAIVIITGLLIWTIRYREMALIYPLFQCMWALLVASFFGTAITRVAAMNVATEDTIGPRETMRFAVRKFSTAIWTLLVPLLALLVYGFVLAVLSLLGRVPGFGHVWYGIMGVAYIVPLLGGLFFAAVMLVYVPSLLLFQPAISAEGNDSFDAVSRSYSYVFSKPWRLAFYAVVAIFYTRIILLVAALLVIWAGKITNDFMAVGIGPLMLDNRTALDLSAVMSEPAGFGWVWAVFYWTPAIDAVRHFTGGNVYNSFRAAGHFGGWVIILWQHLLLAAYLGFAASLLYSVMTQVYFLMRKAVDGTPFDEVYIETPEEEAFAAEFAGAPAPTEVKVEVTPETAAPQGSPQPKVPPQTTSRPSAVDENPIDLAGDERKMPEDQPERKPGPISPEPGPDEEPPAQ